MLFRKFARTRRSFMWPHFSRYCARANVNMLYVSSSKRIENMKHFVLINNLYYTRKDYRDRSTIIISERVVGERNEFQ